MLFETDKPLRCKQLVFIFRSFPCTIFPQFIIFSPTAQCPPKSLSWGGCHAVSETRQQDGYSEHHSKQVWEKSESDLLNTTTPYRPSLSSLLAITMETRSIWKIMKDLI